MPARLRQLALRQQGCPQAKQGSSGEVLIADLAADPERLSIPPLHPCEVTLIVEQFGEITECRRHAGPIADLALELERLLVLLLRSGEVSLIREHIAEVVECRRGAALKADLAKDLERLGEHT